MSILSREEIFALDDIDVKEVTIPDHIKAWGGKTVYIRQLTRGEQDEYFRRQLGNARMRQDTRQKGTQDIIAMNLYGHDAWLCIKGCVDAEGKAIFQASDEEKLKTKNGEPIGWLALQIIEFSGMKKDVEEATALQNMEADVKN